MRYETLRESEKSPLSMSPEEALALQKVGRDLRSKTKWWGASEDTDDEQDTRSVLSCVPTGDSDWDVTVHNAVGVIRVGELQITVEPKIPLPHLLFLFQLSQRLPRFDPEDRLRANLDTHYSLWELIAHWYITAVERALRLELTRDYRPTGELIPSLRGRVSTIQLPLNLLRGKLEFLCEFDEFGENTPLNRVLRAAAECVASNQSRLCWPLRKRALRSATLLSEAGPLEPRDLMIQLDQRTSHCREAFALASHVLRTIGRTAGHGEAIGWTFLIPTPTMVEEGIRVLLQDRLSPLWLVQKQRRGTQVTFTPDLVFDEGLALADVKYKRPGKDWSRVDLYQAIAFAAAFRSNHTAVVYFQNSHGVLPPAVQVGDVHVERLAWPSDAHLTVDAAAETFCASVVTWLERCRVVFREANDL